MQSSICQDIDFGSARGLPALQRWVIFSLIISHPPRGSFSLRLKITGMSQGRIDLQERNADKKT